MEGAAGTVPSAPARGDGRRKEGSAGKVLSGGQRGDRESGGRERAGHLKASRGGWQRAKRLRAGEKAGL